MAYEFGNSVMALVVLGWGLAGVILVCYGLFKAYIRRSIK